MIPIGSRQDQEAIRRYYMKNGFADFRIIDTEVVYQNDPPGYVITITIDEGPQYHVSGVSVDSRIPKVDGPGARSVGQAEARRRL